MKTAPYLRPGSTGFYNSANEWQCTGSMMGRAQIFPDDREAPQKLHLRRVPFVDQCYDRGGAYWGAPANLWCAWNDECEFFVRSNSRHEAKQEVYTLHRPSRFYR